MRKKLRQWYLGLILVPLAGCGVNQAFRDGVDAGWAVIGPRYVKYVVEDQRLDPREKEIQLRTANDLSKLISRVKEAP